MKRHPVPFAEYIPLRSLARRVSSEVDRVQRDMVAGTSVGVLDIAGVPVADVICFEIAYDDLVRDTVLAGGQVTVQTNNATFGRSAESAQQLEMVTGPGNRARANGAGGGDQRHQRGYCPRRGRARPERDLHAGPARHRGPPAHVVDDCRPGGHPAGAGWPCSAWPRCWPPSSPDGGAPSRRHSTSRPGGRRRR